MPRKLYSDTDPPTHPNTVLEDRIPGMRGYFNSLPGDYNVDDCDNLAQVFAKYPELYTDEHRMAVHAIWIAGGHMLDT